MRIENFPKAEELGKLTHPALLEGPENLMERATNRLANFIIQRNLNGCKYGRIHMDSILETAIWGDEVIEKNLVSLLKRGGYKAKLKTIGDGSAKDKVIYIEW